MTKPSDGENNTATVQVLFVDDDAPMLETLLRSLKRRSDEFSFHCAHTTSEAQKLVTALHPAVAVIDLSINPEQGPKSGLELLSHILEIDSSTRVLVLTGHGATEYGIEALHLGAASFLEKPADPIHLLALISDAAAYAKLKRQHYFLDSAHANLAARTGLNTKSPRMIEVLEAIAYAGSNKQPVLLCGETGTGKGVVAQAIHSLQVRGSGNFIRFQPSFGTGDLVASELFGHTRGSFTGAREDRKGLIESAHNGTLFIDEVDELPHETQVLLLNVLQERRFRRVGSDREQQSNFRLLAATNRPINELVATSKMREDFFHRIAHFTIQLPPLRERKEDIPDLAQQFVRTLANRESLRVQAVTKEGLLKLARYSWPGNVRELQAVVEGGAYRAAFHQRNFVEAVDLHLKPTKSETSPSGLSFRERVHQFEYELVQEALKKHDNHQSRAAESLGLDRSSFRRILQRQGDVSNG